MGHEVGASTLRISLILLSSESKALIAWSLNRLKSAMLRAVLDVAVLPMAVTGVLSSRPPSPLPVVIVPVPLPIGKMMGHAVPVAVPMALDTALAGVVGAVPDTKFGSAVFTRVRSYKYMRRF